MIKEIFKPIYQKIFPSLARDKIRVIGGKILKSTNELQDHLEVEQVSYFG